MRNIALIRNRCSDSPIKDVMLMTDFWDELSHHAEGEQRHQELTSRREWKGYMVSKGSKIRHFLNDESSVLSILSELIDKPRVTLEIQKEMVDQGLDIFKAKAGAALNHELAELTKKHPSRTRPLRTRDENCNPRTRRGNAGSTRDRARP
ncbi:uncharacterized protein Z518_01030 [Rhinocladiella mackenziei CBS 650.93]|uniref:Uncharacterized protein n=1 Tax=Rhinocladiella mackenziei CBS 650.93 TaxID=1442369 RepID=A0A0D2IV45_9EURO|nr:uncharacterized protein Z518_01030 [Rhinocladiella mackenziei CBS 650.93]KIX09949.1 hypothetical protein Z518_01030 [Rhinocladiella mackenziei CBS 650.93]